ncbi:hypothetical protein J6I39_02360 [bacterium]|nr:hypothetical protein [bacterium]
MASFLDNILGSATEVYIAVSPSNRIEMGVVDPHTHLLKSYAHASIEYNEAIREISDYDMFSAKLERLFTECNLIPSKCNIHISLPTIWFGYKDNIPLTSDEEAIKNIVFSELDQTYIFKRTDPVPYWFDAPVSLESDTKSIFYTAIQSEVLDTIRNVFKEMGANLIEITCSLTSDLKGLISCGYAEAEMNNDTSNWSLMIVNNSGFQLFGFQGKQISDFYEEPLPVKSFEDNEIYSAIENAAQIALMSSPSDSLVIISETDLVSARELSKRLQSAGRITVIEDNKYRKKPLSDITRALIPELQPEVSLHMLGMFPEPSIFPLSINFLQCIEGYARNDIIEIPISADKTIILTRPKAMLISIILFAALVLPITIGWGITSAGMGKYVNQIEELDNEITNTTAELKKYQNKEGSNFDPYREIENVLKYNRTKIIAYSALGDSVPKNLYLSYFMTGDNGYIDIQGYANTVEDVYVFFQNMKDSLVDSNLRLSKLDLKTSSLEDVIESSPSAYNSPYVFEITNMDEGQLSSFMNALRNSGQDNNSGNQDEQNKNNNQNNNQPNQKR